MKKRIVLVVALLWSISAAAMVQVPEHASAQEKVERVEPPFWWAGMQTPLQIMIYGPGLGEGTLESASAGLEIMAVHKADSPNYLFVDVRLTEGAPGTYTLRWKKGRKKLDIPYVFHAREEGSALRQGLTPADVLYLLMPDRFVNGNPHNDQTPCTVEKPNINQDYGRHGGDLEGIRHALDYLARLGVTSIWPTPLTLDDEARVSYHGYACADYYKIDPRFGTNQMYRDLVQEAAGKGITFLQDMVPNHCGTAHWWMEDVPFKDWIHVFDTFTRSNYAMNTHMDPHAARFDRDLCTDGWFDTSMPDMNLENPFVLQYFIQVAVWWMEYVGLAGVRIDTYPYSNKEAMGAYSAALRKEYPNATVLAECWYPHPQQIAYWERGPYPDGPTVMDFPLTGEIFRALREDTNIGWGDGMVRIYNVLSHDFVYKNPFELLIFGENHDTNRMYELMYRNPDKLKMAYVLLATMRGIPQIYAGTEVLLGAKDPERLGHGEERVILPQRVLTQEGRSPEEEDMYGFISRLLTWRKTSHAVANGKMIHFLPNMIENTYVYFRISSQERLMVIINNSKQPVSLDWEKYAEGVGNAKNGREVFTGVEVEVGQPCHIPPQTAWVIALD